MAEEFLSPIDMLLDENNVENIKLYNEDNQEVEFEQIALIPLEEKTYAILKPVDAMDGIADDEALVFVIDEIDDEDCLVIVEDDAVVDNVFAEYYKMLDEEGVSFDEPASEEPAEANEVAQPAETATEE